ncbi:MAG: 6-phosphofructokinase [Chloroflexi bacterium]|nr:6-phosphofructokinase [Chloroflexota bacterium]
MHIGVLTGGGDCPGLNAAIRAVVRRAAAGSHSVTGVRNGWAGLVDPDAPDPMRLEPSTVSGILAQGGTILGTSRTNPVARAGGLDAVEWNIRGLGLDGLVAIGGDDTLSVAAALAARGGAVVGIPKTMDNDVELTEACIGFDSAATTVMQAIDKLQTTAASHHRVMVVEVMGRDAGWIATYGGLAGGADAILVPERTFDIEALVRRLLERQTFGTGSSIVVVAEGVAFGDGEAAEPAAEVDAFGHPRLDRRGVGESLGRELERRTGIETRVTVLGHLQRGGAPSLFDRIMATRYGVAAVEALEAGRIGVMVALQANRIVEVPLADVAGRNRKVEEAVYALAALLD